jgi:hypothetical protein
MVIATAEIESERGTPQADEELETLGGHLPDTSTGDTSYRGVATTAPYPYQGDTDK